MFEIFKLIEAGAGWREQNGIALRARACASPTAPSSVSQRCQRNRIAHLCLLFFQRLRRSAALRALCRAAAGSSGVIAVLVLAAEDHP